MASSKNTTKKSNTKSTKTTPKKKAAPKKTTAKKAAPKKQTVPVQESIFRKKTIAERTVAFKTRNWGAVAGWIGIVFFSLLALFLNFCMVGYSFSVLVCLCIIGIILVYKGLNLLSKKYPRDGRTLKRFFTVILCIGLLVVGVTECIIIEASFGDPKEHCDYMVVLGAKVRAEGPSVSLMDRIYGAKAYMDSHPDVIAVVSGGQGADEPMTEARCMYEELVELGVDPQRIWIEDQATSTWENLNYSLNLIEEKTGARPEKIGILSSEYHLFRASLFADACGVESVGIPAATSRLPQKINHFMREVAGVWHYLLLGGQYE